MGNDQVALPTGVLREEVHIASEGTAWERLTTRLREDAPNEGCTFVLTRPSLGRNRATVLLGEPIWPEPGEVIATPYSLEIKGDYISRSIDRSIDAGARVGLALVHTHPFATTVSKVGEFSSRDDWYEDRLFPTLTLGRREALFASIVLGANPARVDARMWWKQERLHVQPAHAIRIVSKTLRMLETPHSGWTDHPDPEVVDRSTRLWGAEGRRRLQNLRIGVVGAGGTGSIVLVSSAMMGVGKIRGWDPDLIQKSNRIRLLGATCLDVGKKKIEVLKAFCETAATANPFEFEGIDRIGTSPESLTELKDCDVIFSCVDKLAPRVPLNDLAYTHLIPTLDMGSWIHENNGIVDAFMTHAQLLTPSMPCARCTQKLSPRALKLEAQGVQRDAERRAGYGLNVAAQGDNWVEPSVLPLNMTGVGLAMLQFMQLVMQLTPRTPRNLTMRMPLWDLDESDLEALPDCGCQQDAGIGDV